MKIKRKFTRKKDGPYYGLEFETRTSQLNHLDGSQSTELTIKVPKHFSNVASDILAQKYARKTGVPKTECETDSRDIFHRLARCFRDWGEEYHYFSSEIDADNFEDEIKYMLANQIAAPNSPQWFNTGLYNSYGIEGSDNGHYYIVPETEKCKRSKGSYSRPAPHACFIQSVEDDLLSEDGIMGLITKEARVFKFGSGSGSNFSKIRGKGEKLAGGGESSGLLSFLKINDKAAGAIKSGGTTRRAAKMVTLDLDHPDIEEFIEWKAREERKVAALVTGCRICHKYLSKLQEELALILPKGSDEQSFNLNEHPSVKKIINEAITNQVPEAMIFKVIEQARQGLFNQAFEVYDTDWNSEAYDTVSGQNSNNSIRIPDIFFKKLKEDGDWDLIRRTDQQISKKVKAKTLWENINLASWNSADPGLQFDTTINDWHTCKEDGRINASNPCSEYMFLDDTACNLASLNLLKFYNTKTNKFETDKFIHACELWTIALEISVLMAQFPSKQIAQRSFDYRTLGLGFANLGALLMVQGISYDSDEARELAGVISALMGGTAYKISALLAKEHGSFKYFEKNKKSMLEVVGNHLAAVESGDFSNLSKKPDILSKKILMSKYPELFNAAKESWEQALRLGIKHGYRNAQVTVVAPTGTIGLLMDCDTTGIEPDFALVKFKKLAGGGYFKIINQSVPLALKNLKYKTSEIKKIIQYALGSGSFKNAPHLDMQFLIKLGFTKNIIQKMEQSLANAMDINFIFSEAVLSRDFLLNKLNINESELNNLDFNLLEHLGLSVIQIQEANEYICGTMTLEGAPELKVEHYPVFDCANRTGRIGKRCIAPHGHIKMMSHVQPFISGAISKTVNLPYESSVNDIKKIHEESFELGLKSIAIYRDGSKLSQPLMAQNFLELNLLMSEAPIDQIKQTAKELTKQIIYKEVSKKKNLPNRRNGYTQKSVVGGHKIFLRTGEYQDGSLGEIFVDMHKEGAAFRSLMNCFSIAISLGLQYGVPLEEFVESFTFTRFEPNGIVIGHDNIKMSTSVIDYIFRDLGMRYLERYDLVHVKPEDLDSTAMQDEQNKQEPLLEIMDKKHHHDGRVSEQKSHIYSMEANSGMENELRKRQTAKLKGYEGDSCPSCGALTLVRNGACLKCDSCGETTGCS